MNVVRQVYSLFEITNANQLAFSYRLFKATPPLPDDGLRAIRAQEWADQLWKRNGRPVFPKRQGKDTYFLLPHDLETAGADLTWMGPPERLYDLEPTANDVRVDLSRVSEGEQDFVKLSLERSFTNHLLALPDGLWRDTWTRFFRQAPENLSNARDRALAYRGVHFSVIPMSGSRLFLALDAVTRFVSRHSLAWYLKNERMEELHRHIDEKRSKRAALIRDNGDKHFTCFFHGLAHQTVSEYSIEGPYKTVLGYYQKQYPRLSISPDDEVILVIDGRNPDRAPTPAPASRLFPSFGTEDTVVQRCSVSPTLSPDTRYELVATFRSLFDGAMHGNNHITVSSTPLTEPLRYFPVPPLEFGGGYQLKARVSDGPLQVFASWNKQKSRALVEHLPFHTEALPSLFLLYPDTLRREDRELLLTATEAELGALGSNVPVVKQIPYRPDARGRDLQAQTARIADSGQYALVMCVLSDAFQRQVHGEFKNVAMGLASQCIQESKVASVASSKPKLRNFVLGVLVAAGIKPWVLATPLNADAYLGVDVLDGRVLFNYLYGLGGRITYQSMARTHKELIKRRPFREEIIRTLPEISSIAPLERLIIHRDGRLWPDEIKAIDEGITELRQAGVLSETFRYCAVEIRKSHAPIRIFHQVEEAFRNPFPGCYLILNDRQGLLNNTGKPITWDEQNRTASTLLVNLIHNPGDFSVADVVRDVFYLSQLNWSAPELDISLPVTIRWADDALRDEVLLDFDD